MQLYWREFQSHSDKCFDCVNELVRIMFPRCTVGVNQAIPWRQNDTGASMCDCSLSATEFECIDWTFLTTCQILPTLTNTVGNIKKELFFVVMANICRWWECFWSITLWYSAAGLSADCTSTSSAALRDSSFSLGLDSGGVMSPDDGIAAIWTWWWLPFVATLLPRSMHHWAAVSTETTQRMSEEWALGVGLVYVC